MWRIYIIYVYTCPTCGHFSYPICLTIYSLRLALGWYTIISIVVSSSQARETNLPGVGCIMVYGSTHICRDDPRKKMAATIKVHKWHTQNACVKLAKTSMSHITHYWVLSWATEPLSSLEHVADISDRQVTKMSKSSIFRLTDWLTDWLLSVTVARQWLKLLQRSKCKRTA